MCHPQEGFTLIEVLVAAFIIGVAVTGLVMGFSHGLALVEEVREVSTADQLVEEKMEEIRATDPAQIESCPPEKKGDFTYEVMVDPVPGISNEISIVTVVVRWSSHLNPSRQLSRSLITYVTEEGINKY